MNSVVHPDFYYSLENGIIKKNRFMINFGLSILARVFSPVRALAIHLLH